MLAEFTKRIDKLDKEINKLVKEQKELQQKLDHFQAVDSVPDKPTRKRPSTKTSHESTVLETQARIHVLKQELEVADKARAACLEDSELAVKVKDILSDNYTRIISHSPYLRYNVECTVNDLKLLSVILSKPKTGSQTMHSDSRQRGCSLLMSAEKRQYLTVLLNSFKAMRSLDRMLPKRTEALQYVRARLAAETPDGESAAWADSDWDEKAEIRVWNYLCCLQFKHEKIGAIEAVLVPIEEGETLVVDNRTLHGGTRGGETRGFRFHAYGYVRDVRQRKTARFEKDEDITIDPLDVQLGLYPVCRWAQLSVPPVFRA